MAKIVLYTLEEHISKPDFSWIDFDIYADGRFIGTAYFDAGSKGPNKYNIRLAKLGTEIEGVVETKIISEVEKFLDSGIDLERFDYPWTDSSLLGTRVFPGPYQLENFFKEHFPEPYNAWIQTTYDCVTCMDDPANCKCNDVGDDGYEHENDYECLTCMDDPGRCQCEDMF